MNRKQQARLESFLVHFFRHFFFHSCVIFCCRARLKIPLWKKEKNVTIDFLAEMSSARCEFQINNKKYTLFILRLVACRINFRKNSHNEIESGNLQIDTTDTPYSSNHLNRIDCIVCVALLWSDYKNFQNVWGVFLQSFWSYRLHDIDNTLLNGSHRRMAMLPDIEKWRALNVSIVRLNTIHVLRHFARIRQWTNEVLNCNC